MFTTRQVVDRIFDKVRSNQPEDSGCLSMRAFFRVRKAFELEGVARQAVRTPRASPVITEPLFQAGAWARTHVPPGCVEYLVAHDNTAYWLHLAVLGNLPQAVTEAFGNVNLEAMACGVPVISARVASAAIASKASMYGCRQSG